MRFYTRWAFLTLAIASLAHCTPQSGVIGAAGFSQDEYRYRVTYRDPSQKIFISPDWQIDNYYFDQDTNTWKQKTGSSYVAVREFDSNDDGAISLSERTNEPIYDLKLTNTKDNGILWVKAHPIMESDSKRDLEVLLDDYADALAGTGLYAQGNLFSLEHVKARTHTTWVTSKQPITIGSHPGLVGEIELADTDRLKLDPNYRSAKVKVAFVRFLRENPFDAPGGNMAGGSIINSTKSLEPTKPAPPPPRGAITKQDGSVVFVQPALLVVGYFNTASKYEDHLKDFDALLGQIVLPDVTPKTDKSPAGSLPDGGR